MKLRRPDHRAGVSLSPPTRGRGLKRCLAAAEEPEVASPPTRGRGLKHVVRRHAFGAQSRPPRGGAD